VTVNKSKDIEVRLVQTGQMVHTIRTGDDGNNRIRCITLVPGHSEWIVTGHVNGAVHLWDIGEKGARASECVNATAGGHVRQIMQLKMSVNRIVASSAQFMCMYDDTKVAIVHFDDGNDALPRSGRTQL
jgi:hypothetical protein